MSIAITTTRGVKRHCFTLQLLCFQAVLVKLILSYLESSDDNVWYGLGLAASLLTCQITRACAFQAVAIYGPQTGQNTSPYSFNLRPFI